MALVERWQGSSLGAAQKGLARASQSLRQGNAQEAIRLAQQAESQLAMAARTGLRRLEAGQRLILSAAMAQQLEGMGYTVRLAAEERAVGLWATKGAQTVAVAVTGRGRVDMDMAGFDGLSCRQESQRLMDALARGGFKVWREASVFHGRRGGGAMIRRVTDIARQEGIDPACGILRALGIPAGRPAAAPRSRATVRQGGSPDQEQERARRWLWSHHMKTRSVMRPFVEGG